MCCNKNIIYILIFIILNGCSSISVGLDDRLKVGDEATYLINTLGEPLRTEDLGDSNFKLRYVDGKKSCNIYLKNSKISGYYCEYDLREFWQGVAITTDAVNKSMPKTCTIYPNKSNSYSYNSVCY